jgi:hypothetical protein
LQPGSRKIYNVLEPRGVPICHPDERSGSPKLLNINGRRDLEEIVIRRRSDEDKIANSRRGSFSLTFRMFDQYLLFE